MNIYLVGGAVRDQLLGVPVYDHDWVVVGATAEAMVEQGYQPVGKDFPVFLHPQSKEEYALARTERKSGHGYKGFEFYASPEVTLEEDLRRRDLTINAMAMDQDGQLIDPFHGQEDLKRHCLRHVSAAFVEDPLRVLRVARFNARFAHLGFTVADETLALMEKLAVSGELSHLTAERVWQECYRALGERSPDVFFSLLHQSQALKELMPEIDERWTTATSADCCRLLAAASEQAASPELRLALLCYQLDLDESALSTLLERLKAPNDSRRCCLLLRRALPQVLEIDQLTAEQKLSLYQTLDLQRRPEHLAQVVLAQRILHAAQLADQGDAEQALLQLIQLIDAIQPAALAAEGYKGKALGDELQRRRLARIQEF